MASNAPPTPPPEDTPEVEKTLDPTPQPAPAADPAPETPAQNQSAEQPPAPPEADNTIYHTIFPTLVSFGAEKNYEGLINIAELYDLRFENDSEEARLLLITPLVLSYLIIDDLPPARHAITRLPPHLSTHPLSQAVFNLLAASWERNHIQVYARSNVLLSLVEDVPNLNGLIPPMVSNFLDSFRLRTINLISKAYTSLSLSLAESYLGLPKDQLLSVVAELNWAYDANQQILSPCPLARTKPVEGSVSVPSSLLTFGLVADGVALLEG